MPESVRLLLILWVAAISGEIVHQLLNIAIGLMDPSVLIAAAKEGMDADTEAVSDAAVSTSVYASIVIAGTVGILIMALLAWMLSQLRHRSPKAGMARRMLMFFGIYFGFRVLMIFIAIPADNDVPIAMYLIDGSLQILVGVAATMGLVFSFRPEVLVWTREIESGKTTRS
ncbi:hypothetical protein C5L39_06620 [Corynebacterium alimapuense]|uniref:Uncharacterized protein n=2 Tax=Corynebacterium alimapuense TaxID=1576874 RepID=A0A3M8K6W5_9CORY|nr:hypothetical protein C5L39_06620 [Corynebacterium alimapuense]